MNKTIVFAEGEYKHVLSTTVYLIKFDIVLHSEYVKRLSLTSLAIQLHC